MHFREPLIAARLVRRYKRFLADVELDDGRIETAHCPNPGRMLGLDTPGAAVLLSRSPNPKRALPLTLEMVETEGGLVGINTMLPNRLVLEALRAGDLDELGSYPTVRPEVRYDERCRIDLLLQAPGRPDCYVEVKNVHLRRAHAAEFPDSVTVRGARHLAALGRRVAAGERAVALYVVQRMDCTAFRIAGDIDPAYAAAFAEARQAGVEVVVRACRVAAHGIWVAERLPVQP